MPAESETNEVGLQVEALAENGERVSGARVHLLAGNGRVLVHGTTDEVGRFFYREADETLDHVATTVVVHPRYQRAAVPVPTGTRPWVQRVVLRRGATIRGRVELSDGSPPQDAVAVVGVPRGMGLLFGVAMGPEHQDPRIAHTRTDSLGGFVLETLAPGVRYTLVCGCPGWVGTVAKATAGDIDVVLRLRPLYGVIVRFVTEDGVPVHISPRLGVARGIVCSWGPPRGACVVSEMSLGAQFAGSASLLRDERLTGPGRAKLFLMVGNDDQDRHIGPMTYQRHLPGFEPVVMRLPLERFRDSVPLIDVPLCRTTAGEGGPLRISFDGFYETPPHSDPAALGFLQLVRDEGEDLAYSVYPDEAGGAVVHGLPAGRYAITFLSYIVRRSDYRPPAATYVEVGPGGANVTIPVRGLGALQLRLTENPETRVGVYLRRVTLRRSEDEQQAFVDRVYEDWDPVMHSLPAGVYMLRVFEHLGKNPVFEQEVCVVAGEVVEVEAFRPAPVLPGD